MLSDARLPEQNGAPRRQPDGDRHGHEERREKHQSSGRGHDVEEALHGSLDWPVANAQVVNVAVGERPLILRTRAAKSKSCCWKRKRYTELLENPNRRLHLRPLSIVVPRDEDLADDLRLEQHIEIAHLPQELRREAIVDFLVRKTQVPDDAAVVLASANFQTCVAT